MKIKINLYGTRTALLASTDESAMHIKDHYYGKLAEQLHKGANYQDIFLTGYLNGRVGSEVDSIVVDIVR